MKYSIILIPRMNVKRMIEKDNLHKKAKRIMQNLYHGQFIKRLIDKGIIKGKHVIIVSEYLTSQTCGICFNTYKTDSKTYKCDKCNTEIDRDINGARNIYIKYIGDFINNIK